ncbi:hypothetical protein H112_07142 [Trichophyton rubrum D6]|uniref:Peptidase S1 domain-containing protein n=1 Tax=Trichophyton rubrum CBS 288.86 TaxID=1215330 RepID=A0A022VTJ8_TRIRU|nr:hypothetical protein H100_07167 [Trichophyton rubrum MR850]EZF38645.1 hypothetical protein H102_07127 [Trichophyton rubrum CBS 100081]EZF49269.1 hypothetical protein H103_07150 [Trichophyton rubrum CBS 288.86]EZF59897.1 hypothetical protein H104_07104 [Trichophyton rubrum CBS 289.86]EZF81158.1 hypothetical protein H110_07150 [Trichophyton rubrum MR1448]EZF91706.1 hypothetical protein H113_07203 [Trichophyton rubrum MR1459]EZG13431.1 hypothetical protein H107_07310 [Trichophyton rubrum CBS 
MLLTKQNYIAILQLQNSLEFGPSISAILLLSPDDAVPEIGTKCSLTGWETTGSGSGSLPQICLSRIST